MFSIAHAQNVNQGHVPATEKDTRERDYSFFPLKMTSDLKLEDKYVSSILILATKCAFRKIFVGGLHSCTTDECLGEYFKKFGEIEDASVMYDSLTKRSRGFGFVTFKDPQSVHVACLGQHTLNDKKVINYNRNVLKLFLSFRLILNVLIKRYP